MFFLSSSGCCSSSQEAIKILEMMCMKVYQKETEEGGKSLQYKNSGVSHFEEDVHLLLNSKVKFEFTAGSRSLTIL